MKNNTHTTAVWSYRDSNSKLSHYSFGLKDLNHTKRIYKEYEITPESLEKVSLDFILQKEKLIRFAIKELDILLKIDGKFEINIIDSKNHSAYFLSRDQVKYEFSLATNGRYYLTNVSKNGDYLKLEYTKKKSTLLIEDAIQKWSFGIITNGKKLDFVNNLINSINQQNIPAYEILICGPYPKNEKVDYTNIQIIDDVIIEGDTRFPIPAKKNKIISQAKYNNLCILHDRFSLPVDWFKNMANYGNYFDYLCIPTLDKYKNRFAVDWMTFSFPLTRRIQQNRSLPYHVWSPEVIIQGGVIVGKRNLMSKYKIDERLHWEEFEDMHFSKVAYLDGAFFYLDPQNYFISESVNHKALKGETKFKRLKEIIYWNIGIAKSFIKFNSIIKKYYKNKA